MSTMATTPDPQAQQSASPLDGCDARELVEQSLIGHLVVQDGLIAYANPTLATMLGWNVDELIGQQHEVTIPSELHESAREVVRRRLDGKTGRPGQWPCRRRDGSVFDARVSAGRVRFAGRPAVLVTLYEIPELTAALRRSMWNADMLARTESLCRSGSFAVSLPDGSIVLSSGLRQLIECSDGRVVHAIDALDWVPADERDLVASIWRRATVGEPFDFKHRVVTRSGRLLNVLHRGRVELLPDGRHRGVALLQDITAQCEAELRLQQLATRDEVTGLPNRAAFIKQIDAAIVSAGWEERIVAVLAVDVARIAEVKAKMGFAAAAALAMGLAARLQGQCGEGEAIAHLGDSEFALMVDLPQPAATASASILERARALREALEHPVRVGSTDIFARCVVGVASFPGDSTHPVELLGLAETARLRATPDDAVVVYAPDSNVRALREMQIEALLRQAVAGDELELHYQPQVSLADGAVVGAEALLRWTSPVLGSLSPSEFIPIAERTGLIGAVGDWVLRHVCRQIVEWHAAGVPVVRVGVNVAPSQLQRPDLAVHFQNILRETGVDTALIGIEVTESAAMADVAHAAAVLNDIKALGIEISLDDFGTGFSSVSRLPDLPIDVVKVDRSFVHDVTAAPQHVSVTRAILTMAHGLQMRVLAEGVETEGQLSLLGANCCDLVQGNWFSHPLPAADFATLLREGRKLPPRFVTRARPSRTLLLVDDEEHVLAALKRLLRRDGYTIVTAGGAAEGLKRLAECEVDVIVSDQRMPGMTGVEFLRRAKELYPHTTRMMLSGYTELQSILDAINEGAIYKFLTKPWEDARLREHIAEAFRQKELADENRRLARQVQDANANYMELNARLECLVAQQREEAQLLALAAGSTREALELLPAAIVAIDGDDTVTYANDEGRRLLASADGGTCWPADEALPPALRTAAAATDGSAPVVALAGHKHRVLVRPLLHRGAARGRILLVIPQHTSGLA